MAASKGTQAQDSAPLPFKAAIMGECAGCGKGLPCGYLPVVTAWATVRRGTTSQGMAIMVPKTLYCRSCGDQLDGPRQHRVTRRAITMPQRSDETEELTADQVMRKLYEVMSTETAMGSKKLARLADIEYSDIILTILRALRKAGKVVFEDGRWRKI